MNRKPFKAGSLKIGITVALMVFGSASADAQQVISLQDAISQALNNKAEAKKSALEIQKSEYKITEARAGTLPRVSVGSNLAYNPIIQQSVIEFGGQKQ